MEKYIPALLHETANREAQGEDLSDIVVTFDVSYRYQKEGKSLLN